MNTDIRIQISFARHVKRRKLQSRIGAAGVLCLIDLWLYAGENHPDGILRGMDEEDIALACNWEGEHDPFIKSLVEVGFLERNGNGFILHDWEDNQPYVVHAPERKERAKKAASARWGIPKACSPHARRMPDGCLPDAPTPTPTPTPTPIPTPIPIPKESIGAKCAKPRRSFQKPALQDVVLYCKERNNNLDPQYFFDYQEARDWILSNGKRMADWQATIRTWEKKGGSNGRITGGTIQVGRKTGNAQSDGEPWPADREY